MARLIKLRGPADCPDGRTCPAVHLAEDRSLRIIGRIVTDPEELAQMAIGPGEVAIAVPAELIPEVSGCGGS